MPSLLLLLFALPTDEAGAFFQQGFPQEKNLLARNFLQATNENIWTQT